MTTKRNEIGPATRQFIENVIRFRERYRITYAEMAHDLIIVGRPIPVLGLRRMEAGERRVDLDEVEALAEIFDQTPDELLGRPWDRRSLFRHIDHTSLMITPRIAP